MNPITKLFAAITRLLSWRKAAPSPTPLPAGLQAWRDAQADFNSRIEAARADHAKVRHIMEERVQFVHSCLRGSA